MAFYELRQYKINPGKLTEWVRFMEEEIIPFQVSKGMVITGSYHGEEDESIYVWTRRFASEEERKEALCCGLRKRLLEKRGGSTRIRINRSLSDSSDSHSTDSQVNRAINRPTTNKGSPHAIQLLATR